MSQRWLWVRCSPGNINYLHFFLLIKIKYLEIRLSICNISNSSEKCLLPAIQEKAKRKQHTILIYLTYDYFYYIDKKTYDKI